MSRKPPDIWRERMGYRERATRAIVKDGWRHAGARWGLLVKRF